MKKGKVNLTERRSTFIKKENRETSPEQIFNFMYLQGIFGYCSLKMNYQLNLLIETDSNSTTTARQQGRSNNWKHILETAESMEAQEIRSTFNGEITSLVYRHFQRGLRRSEAEYQNYQVCSEHNNICRWYLHHVRHLDGLQQLVKRIKSLKINTNKARFRFFSQNSQDDEQLTLGND